MSAPRRLGFGIFLSPSHEPGTDPSFLMTQDLQLIEHADQLGLDEAWVGEHHSAGWGTIASPEMFLAAAATRTRRIRLGTGVVSLPYHHPFMVASRAAQLDHMTRGRAMLGVGAGSLPSDAHMLGITTSQTRPRTAEAAEAVVHLLTSDTPLTCRTDWFTRQDARLQLRPHGGDLEIAVSSASSPFGMRLAGRLGLSPLSFGAALPGTSLTGLRDQWRHAEEEAAAHGRTMDRSRWRLAVSVHVAETREQAFADVREGYLRWLHGYLGDTFGQPVSAPENEGRELEALVESGGALVGSASPTAVRPCCSPGTRTSAPSSRTGGSPDAAPCPRTRRASSPCRKRRARC